MFSRIIIRIKQFATAIFLLLLILLSLEIGLQYQRPPGVETIAATVSPQQQQWLTASATVHHELRRLSELQNPNETSFETNSIGLRGSEIPTENSAPATRILVLGDETILGPELQTSHTVPERLAEFLSKVIGTPIQVLNAGTPGYCPLLSSLRYKHELSSLRPDLVILHVDMSDITDDTTYRRNVRTSGNQQICQNIQMNSLASSKTFLKRLASDSALLSYLRTEVGLGPLMGCQQSLPHLYRWTSSSQSDLRLNIQHALAPIDELQKAAKRDGFLFLVSTTPVPWQVAEATIFPELANQMPDSGSWPITNDLPYQILQAVCDKSNVPLCSSLNAFRSFPEVADLFKPSSTSLSAYGAALYAREIASMLLKEPQFASLFSKHANISVAPQQQH